MALVLGYNDSAFVFVLPQICLLYDPKQKPMADIPLVHVEIKSASLQRPSNCTSQRGRNDRGCRSDRLQQHPPLYH